MSESADWNDTATETSSTSWLERIQGAISGIVFGLGLTVAMVWVLAFNEGRAARTYAALTEGERNVLAVSADRVNTTHEGRLIHVSGDLKSVAPLTDKTFAVSEPAVRLVRHVAMYQWHEKSETKSEKSVGGSETRTTTYRYERRWSEKPINSSDFKSRAGHQNPAFRFQRLDQTANTAELGDFRPGREVLSKLKATQKLSLDDRHVRAVQGHGPVQVLDGNTLYFGADPSAPQIGDMKVHFAALADGPATFVGRQSSGDLVPYLAASGAKILLASSGNKSVAEMFADARFENSVLTWLFRAVGLIFLWLGLFLVLRPLAVIGDLVPVVGSIIAVGAGVVALVGTVLVGGSTIALAWFYHRPMVTGVVMLVSLASLALLNLRKATPAPAPAPATVRRSRPMRPVQAPSSFLPSNPTLRPPRRMTRPT